MCLTDEQHCCCTDPVWCMVMLCVCQYCLWRVGRRADRLAQAYACGITDGSLSLMMPLDCWLSMTCWPACLHTMCICSMASFWYFSATRGVILLCYVRVALLMQVENNASTNRICLACMQLLVFCLPESMSMLDLQAIAKFGNSFVCGRRFVMHYWRFESKSML